MFREVHEMNIREIILYVENVQLEVKRLMDLNLRLRENLEEMSTEKEAVTKAREELAKKFDSQVEALLLARNKLNSNEIELAKTTQKLGEVNNNLRSNDEAKIKKFHLQKKEMSLAIGRLNSIKSELVNSKNMLEQAQNGLHSAEDENKRISMERNEFVNIVNGVARNLLKNKDSVSSDGFLHESHLEASKVIHDGWNLLLGLVKDVGRAPRVEKRKRRHTNDHLQEYISEGINSEGEEDVVNKINRVLRYNLYHLINNDDKSFFIEGRQNGEILGIDSFGAVVDSPTPVKCIGCEMIHKKTRCHNSSSHNMFCLVCVAFITLPDNELVELDWSKYNEDIDDILGLGETATIKPSQKAVQYGGTDFDPFDLFHFTVMVHSLRAKYGTGKVDRVLFGDCCFLGTTSYTDHSGRKRYLFSHRAISRLKFYLTVSI